MNPRKPEIVKEKDVLGMDKPASQLRPLKKRSSSWALILAVIILVITAGILFYFNK